MTERLMFFHIMVGVDACPGGARRPRYTASGDNGEKQDGSEPNEQLCRAEDEGDSNDGMRGTW
jgi:hypothetical protein